MPAIIAEEIEDRLWSEVDKGRIGMLVLAGERLRAQPISVFGERADGQLWFFGRQDSELARVVGEGAEAAFVVQSRDLDLQGCVRGRLVEDRDRIDRYWGAWMEAAFPEGKDDPQLTLFRLDGREAEVWLTESDAVHHAWDLTRSGMQGERPDLGDSRRLDLH